MRVKKYRRILILLFFINLAVICSLLFYNIKNKLPSEIKILVGKEEKFDFGLPLGGTLSEGEVSVSQGVKSNIPSGALSIDFNQPFSLYADKTGRYTVDVKLFGLIKLQELDVDVIEGVEVIPCGMPVGITVKTDGILILGTGKVTGESGVEQEPARDIVKSGDYIIKVNEKNVEDKEDMIEEIQKNGAKPVVLQIRRGNEFLTQSINPIKTAKEEYKIGVWIRDDTQGIGTLTYYTNTGDFGALGHGITDVDTGLLLEVGKGELYTSEIVGITKGSAGVPGELSGMIHQNRDSLLGNITKNTNQGIFGKLKQSSENTAKKLKVNDISPMPIGLRQDIQLGDAKVICAVEGERKAYDIRIDQIDFSNKNHSKGLVITITDERLIGLTGGIVQGMSGSPIIQNGKLIGAVTHVFIRDAKSGYGTFIENMLQQISK